MKLFEINFEQLLFFWLLSLQKMPINWNTRTFYCYELICSL